MSDFVWDNTTLPGPKSGGTDGVSTKLSGNEFNTTAQAVKDLRTNYQNGELRPNPNGATGVSATGVIRRRIGSGKAQISENGSSFFTEHPIANAQAFGVVGDGTTDDTAALQAFFNAGGGFLPNPAVSYKVSAPLVVPQLTGFILVGQNPTTTVIQPTAALAGLPVIRLNGCRDSYLSGFRINGSTTGSNQPSAGIEIRADSIGLSTHNTIRDVMLGSNQANSLLAGIKTDYTRTTLTGTVTFTNGSAAVVGTGTHFTTELAVGAYMRASGRWQAYRVASITDDTHATLSPLSYPFGSAYNEATVTSAAERIYDLNNDLHTFANCHVLNVQGPAFSINGLDSIGHRILGGDVQADYGVQTAGGDFQVDGTWFNTNVADFSVLDGTYEHPLMINSGKSESGAALITTTTVPNLIVSFGQYERAGGPAGGNIIDFQATGSSSIRFNGTRIFSGQSNVTARFTATDSYVSFVQCTMGFDHITWNGHLTRLGNYWPLGAGAVTETAGASSTLYRFDETGAGFDGSLVDAWSAKRFGAKGDGIADDTAAISAAITAATAAGGSGAVYLPAGTYATTGITVPANCRLFGQGRSTIIKNTGTGAAVTLTGAQAHIRDFWIQNQNITNQIGVDAALSGSGEFYVENVDVNWGQKGFRVGNCYGGHYRGCVVTGIKPDGSGAYGSRGLCLLDNANGCYFQDCLFTNWDYTLKCDASSDGGGHSFSNTYFQAATYDLMDVRNTRFVRFAHLDMESWGLAGGGGYYGIRFGRTATGSVGGAVFIDDAEIYGVSSSGTFYGANFDLLDVKNAGWTAPAPGPSSHMMGLLDNSTPPYGTGIFGRVTLESCRIFEDFDWAGCHVASFSRRKCTFGDGSTVPDLDVSFADLTAGGTGQTYYAESFTMDVGGTPALDHLDVTGNSFLNDRRRVRIVAKQGFTLTHGNSGGFPSSYIACPNAVNLDVPAGSVVDLTYLTDHWVVTGWSVPLATGSVPGLVSTGAQTLAGTKTLSSGDLVVSSGYVKPLGSGILGGTTRLDIAGQVADGSTAVAAAIGAQNNLVTPGAKVASVRNNMGGTPSEVAFFELTGLLSTAMPHPSLKRLSQWLLQTTADTAHTAVAGAALVQKGTASAAPSDDSSRMMLKFTSSGSINGDAGIWGNAGGVTGMAQFNYRPRLTVIYRTGADVTNRFDFVGLVDNTSMVGNWGGISGFNAHNMIGLWLDTSQGRTTWWAMSSDGATASEVNTGVAFAANTTYVIEVDFSQSGGAIFTVNGTRVVKTTNLPGSFACDVFASARNIVGAGAKVVELGAIALEQN